MAQFEDFVAVADWGGPGQIAFAEDNRGAQLGINHGRVDNHFYSGAPQDENFDYARPVGLCLSQAPYIDTQLFVGRDADVVQMAEILAPEQPHTEQRRLVLGGMGGIGKTQLAISYAKRYHRFYESIFWLNAASETTLKASVRLVAERIFGLRDRQAYSSDQILVFVKRWLSDTNNPRWLLIFDNYDEPQSYDIERYYPYATHGSFIITTRLPDKVSGHPILLRPLRDFDHSLRILETRSQRRDIAQDTHARHLVERLGGLPLALATAGAYLRKSPLSCEQYLRMYENMWEISPGQPVRLREYQDRTFHTTWDLSYKRLAREAPDAARLLKLLAYFDHQAIWYGLLHGGVRQTLPGWLTAAASDFTRFEELLCVLVEYCFVEPQSSIQAYSMHACVHDWTLAGLNKDIDSDSYFFVLECLYASAGGRDLSQSRCARLVPHALRLAHSRFDGVARRIPTDHLMGAKQISRLLHHQFQFDAAEVMYRRVVRTLEKTPDVNPLLACEVFGQFGILCTDQGKYDEAESFLRRAVAGFEREVGPDDPETLKTLTNLGALYLSQRRLSEAEEVLVRALAGNEKATGPEGIPTLQSLCNLSAVHCEQGKRDEAEAECLRALAGYRRRLGPDHISTLMVLDNLGVQYSVHGRLDKAEQTWLESAAGFTRVFGTNHVTTIKTLGNLGYLYHEQGRLDKAEEMLTRAVAAHTATESSQVLLSLRQVECLAHVYRSQGKKEQARHQFQRVASGRAQALGPQHPETLSAVTQLRKLDEEPKHDRERNNLADHKSRKEKSGWRKLLRFQSSRLHSAR